MKENIIVTDKSLINKIVAIIFCALFIIYLIIGFANLVTKATAIEKSYAQQIAELKEQGSDFVTKGEISQLEQKRDNKIGQVYLNGVLTLVLPIIAMLVVAACILWLVRVELFISDKRICKTSPFGIETSIPLDSVTSVTKIGILRGVIIGSASHQIVYLLAEDAVDLNDTIVELLIARQNDGQIEATPASNT